MKTNINSISDKLRNTLFIFGVMASSYMAGFGSVAILGNFINLPDEHEEMRQEISRIDTRQKQFEDQVEERLHTIEQNTNTLVCLIEGQNSDREEHTVEECRPPLFIFGEEG